MTDGHETSEPGLLFSERVLDPLKAAFVGKDEIIDLLGVALIGGENLFLLGPPGTAKSALVQELGRQVHGTVFDYLLTRFTEPNEIFGPFDIRRLREGELQTNTSGMLPEADLVFLDELLNANSAILNSLLTALNERVFRRGRETRKLPALMFVGASNHLPEEEALAALFDRFLLRVRSDNVAMEQLPELLQAGWRMEYSQSEPTSGLDAERIRALQRQVGQVDVTAIRPVYVELIHRLRHAGMTISDRRAVKYQRLCAASALLCGRQVVDVSDLWVLRYTWDLEEQQEVLKSLVQKTMAEFEKDSESSRRHPQSDGEATVNPELLARDLERIGARLKENPSENERMYLRDQLGILCARCDWIRDPAAREAVQEKSRELWKSFEVESEVSP